ncbi:hypothetical protein ACFLWB_00415 [Chloroflexota bacterium]
MKIPSLRAAGTRLTAYPWRRGKILCAAGISGIFSWLVSRQGLWEGRGITEAIVTGLVAGHNAVRAALKKTLWTLPRETAIGDFVGFTGQVMESP